MAWIICLLKSHCLSWCFKISAASSGYGCEELWDVWTRQRFFHIVHAQQKWVEINQLFFSQKETKALCDVLLGQITNVDLTWRCRHYSGKRVKIVCLKYWYMVLHCLPAAVAFWSWRDYHPCSPFSLLCCFDEGLECDELYLGLSLWLVISCLMLVFLKEPTRIYFLA